MKESRWIPILLVAGLLACNGGNQKPQSDRTVIFRRVEVPAMITAPQARSDYLAIHWWDHFDFTDTTSLSHPEITEQALADYLYILSLADPATAREGLTQTLGEASADSAVYSWFREKTEHYLWDPNSPIRNESLYIPVLEYIVASNGVDELVKMRAAKQLETARKNRPGQTATDFTYTLASGRQSRLSRINSEYTLLFLSNPGCPACGELIGQIKSSPILNALEQDKRLTVLTLYPDEEVETWRQHLPDLPADWINAYDQALVMRNEALYDLRAIPSLYLLDRSKTVLLKDATFEQLENYLLGLQQPEP